MAKLGIIYGTNFLSTLTKIFTGSRAYHTAWFTDKYIYDMYLIRRRRAAGEYDKHEVHFYDFPNVTEAFLEERLSSDNNTYGFKDYFLFALRPLFHLVGLSTVNAKGVICSEMTNNDLIDCGYKTDWISTDTPPSPAMQEEWAIYYERKRK